MKDKTTNKMKNSFQDVDNFLTSVFDGTYKSQMKQQKFKKELGKNLLRNLFK